ncbi:hypothetical protein [Nonomuraea typhae]|uniref:hypothetical protein n=1 Tax=Nonomuraea typhae TaxID=2603600 RepID=UPI0012FAE371|nr:hypothetical protein [Nonomuraea typhae]
MSLSDVIRNIAKTVTDKEKAKELPLVVIQSTLSAAGQALLFVDRVKNTIKGLAKQETEEESATRPAADQLTDADEPKPRREPVIFAPRPSSTGTAEPNGTAPKTKVEPVIFTPAKPAEAPAAEAKPETTASTATARPSGGSAAEAAKPEAAEASAAKPAAATTKPEAGAASVAEVEPKTEAAEPEADVAKPATGAGKPEAAADVAASAEAKPAADAAVAPPSPETEAAATAQPEPSTEARPAKPAKPRATRRTAAKPKPAADAAVTPPSSEVEAAATAQPEPSKSRAAKGASKAQGREPLEGYDGLTVASLRARMRGKSAGQIREFLAYEQATQARPAVVKMYENRLAKLEAGE